MKKSKTEEKLNELGINTDGLDLKGLTIRGDAIQLRFFIEKQRFARTLDDWTTTLPGVKRAIKVRDAIKEAIKNETFRHEHFFPGWPVEDKTIFTGKLLIGEMLDDWIEIQQERLERSTWGDYLASINSHLKPKFGHMQVGTLSQHAVQEWVYSLKHTNGKSLSHSRIRNILLPLSGAYKAAVKNPDIPVNKNPVVDIETSVRKGSTRVKTEKIQPFTVQEVQALLKASKSDPLIHYYIKLNVFTGLRPSEIQAVGWEDINLVEDTIHVRRALVKKYWKGPKTMESNRVIKLLPPAREALIELRKYTGMLKPIKVEYDDGDVEMIRPILINPAKNMRWETTDQFLEQFARICRKAKVDYRKPGQLRHTYASNMISSGENILFVANQLGHKDWSMLVKHYGRFMPDAYPDAGKYFMKQWEYEEEQLLVANQFNLIEEKKDELSG